MPPATNPRGRKLGSGAGKKRKAPEELSTNENTKRARERIANMDTIQQEIERAKAADTQARNRALKALRKTDAYKAADADIQASLERNEITKVMNKR
jgi:DNA-binding transcriptional regulator GbsR (MarR family)